jgi:hypothetical protein
VKDFSDTGLPAFLEFEMPAGAEYFTLEVNGTRVHQVLNDRAQAPVSGTPSAPAPVAPPVSTPSAAPASSATPAKKAEEEDDPDAEWRSIHFELAKKDDETDIDLEKHEDK